MSPVIIQCDYVLSLYTKSYVKTLCLSFDVHQNFNRSNDYYGNSGALQTNMVSTATCLMNCIYIIAAETNRTLAVIIIRRVNKLYFFI